MTRPLVHFEIHGKDPARLEAFYRDLFGWRIDASNPNGYQLPSSYRFVWPGVGGPEPGPGGGIVSSDGAPCVIPYVQVVDLEDALNQAVALGGSRVREPIDLPGAPSTAICADPEGNRVGLVKQ